MAKTPSAIISPAPGPQMPTPRMRSEGVLAIEMGATVKDLALTIHPHPTLSETVMEAAELFYGHSSHIFKPVKK
jgi:dihydrolipoamide dehydrogenase